MESHFSCTEGKFFLHWGLFSCTGTIFFCTETIFSALRPFFLHWENFPCTETIFFWTERIFPALRAFLFTESIFMHWEQFSSTVTSLLLWVQPLYNWTPYSIYWSEWISPSLTALLLHWMHLPELGIFCPELSAFSQHWVHVVHCTVKVCIFCIG